ncbi:phosphatase PAP2 family protein [Halorubrum vacuolatum]|uniref:Membrane-associated phospholipid phosphatase n=1 Tax=Halorubrum vacuolatum TaxID=63740 RepID=A0A238WVK4_HALVU|nr:phosphatase PAP2 family protein [Halorubrum vacuolatum]SNR50473.1 Membrane-associated phospholipid phosphatase [Halorubrum vacuolatum]
MTRDVGEFAVVETLPDALIVLLAALTHLADPWFLFGLLAAFYWFGDDRLSASPRRSGATAIAFVTCAYAAVALGKAVFGFPRPPGADPAAVTAADIPNWLPSLLAVWFEGQLTSDGFGFPSGHATGAVVAYGSLALLADRLWSRRRRIALATFIAVVVAISRVAIEVHYLADVAAGGVLGIAVIGSGLWLAGASDRFRASWVGRIEPPWTVQTPPEPLPIFLLAAGVSLLAAGVAAGGGHSGEVVEASIGIGTGLGGALGWALVSGKEPTVPLGIAVPALLVTGGVWAATFGLDAGPILAVLATGVAVATVLALPSLATWVGE